LGFLEWENGKKDKAAELFDKLLALQIDPDTPSVRIAGTPTSQRTSGSSQSSSGKPGWPLALSSSDTASAVVSLLGESAASDDAASHSHAWSGDQIISLMPDDYGEARIFCLAAKLLKARDEDRVPELLNQLAAVADSSLQSAWDVLYAEELSAWMDPE